MTADRFLLVYCVLFLGIGIALLWIKIRIRQERAPFPENTRLLRGPGESLQRQLASLDEQLLNSLLLLITIPTVVGLGLGFLISLAFGGTTGFVVCAGGTLSVSLYYSVVMISRFVDTLRRRRNTALGYFGERIVAEHLEPLKAAGHRVFHDVPAGDPPAGASVPPYNIDHVVVGPHGVFAIETKTRRKGRARVGFMAHEIIYDGRALAYPWGEDQHGLEQARGQAEWLATFLQKQIGQSVPVRPFLVFPGWMIIRKASGAVTVLNPRELPAALTQPPRAHTGFVVPTLNAAAIDLIARQLETRCRDVEL